MSVHAPEFSFRTRSAALARFRDQEFDLLVIGGGITGAATARDAASRGLRVALVEKGDFASGTSSASSKLIHGGLRYLENFEFKLVFEALSERTHLLRAAPHLVRPLKFYLPVYRGDKRGKNLLSLGLWLYDTLARFAPPGVHERLSRRQLMKEVPSLNDVGLKGGFTYYDASMWDDVIAVENARVAHELGAEVATYAQAMRPLWDGERVSGFAVRDILDPVAPEILLRAKRTVLCVGAWTDRVGEMLLEGAPAPVRDRFPTWPKWLEPSRGVHLVFDRTRFPMPAAMLMTHPEDGRVSFVIPREDFGPGVVVVGTTDGPSPRDPEAVRVERSDEDYLLDLLNRYFPRLKLTIDDVISSYVGIRPLMDPKFGQQGGGGGSLAQVSREHHVGSGPGGLTLVAGGKYTTHRTMAQDIVDHVMKDWLHAYYGNRAPRPPSHYKNHPRVDGPLSPAVPDAEAFNEELALRPSKLTERYGLDARRVADDDRAMRAELPGLRDAPEGFPGLYGELVYALKHEMAMVLEDFCFRRQPLYLTRRDHGEPWFDSLSRVWARVLGKTEAERTTELARLRGRVREREGGAR